MPGRSSVEQYCILVAVRDTGSRLEAVTKSWDRKDMSGNVNNSDKGHAQTSGDGQFGGRRWGGPLSSRFSHFVRYVLGYSPHDSVQPWGYSSRGIDTRDSRAPLTLQWVLDVLWDIRVIRRSRYWASHILSSPHSRPLHQLPSKDNLITFHSPTNANKITPSWWRCVQWDASISLQRLAWPEIF